MIHFYFGSGSPFSWRVQMALEEKALPYEPHLLSFQAGDLRKPEYLAISPHAKVPAIVDGDLRLYESQPILEYLDEQYPAKSLLPADPAVRALVRVEEMECVLYFMEAVRPLVRLAFFTPPDQRDEKALADARAEVAKQLATLDGRCAVPCFPPGWA